MKPRQETTPKERMQTQCNPGEFVCDLCLRIRPARMAHVQTDGKKACPICVADGRATADH